MKKNIFTATLLFIFTVFMPISSYAFDIYGYWLSNQKYPLNVIGFEKEKYYYGKYSLPAKISKQGNVITVQFMEFSTLNIEPQADDTISVTFPDPSLPKNIVYKRISKEEATKITEKR